MPDKAKIAPIQFGNRQIQGLLLPESTSKNPVFGIALSQTISIVTDPHKDLLRQLNVICGKGLIIPQKYSTELNSRPAWVISHSLRLKKLKISF